MGLALGAEVGATVSDGDALNRGAAGGAGLASPVSYLEGGLCRSRLAAGTHVGISAGPLIVDGGQEHLAQRLV